MEVRDVFIPSPAQVPVVKAAEIPKVQFSQVMEQCRAAEKPAAAPTQVQNSAQGPAKDSAQIRSESVSEVEVQLRQTAESAEAEEAAVDASTAEDTDVTAEQEIDLAESFADLESMVAAILNEPREPQADRAPEPVTEADSGSIGRVMQEHTSKVIENHYFAADVTEKAEMNGKLMDVILEPQIQRNVAEIETKSEAVAAILSDSVDSASGSQMEENVEAYAEISAKSNVKSEPQISKSDAENVRTGEGASKMTLEVKPENSGENGSGDAGEKGKKTAHEFSVAAGTHRTENVKHYEVMNAKADAPVSIARQVAEAVVVDVKLLPTGQTVEVQLTPEHLGKVVMKLELQEGVITANIKVENQEVKSALEASIQELRNSLTEKGITVKEVSVEINKDGHRGGQQYSGGNGRQKGGEEETKRFELKTEKEEQIEYNRRDIR